MFWLSAEKQPSIFFEFFNGIGQERTPNFYQNLKFPQLLDAKKVRVSRYRLIHVNPTNNVWIRVVL
jgi:hypothetical protein